MFRLKKHKQGWIVEVKKAYWTPIGIFHKWVHVTHWAGMPENPYYYKTPESARNGALDEIRDEINYTFYFETK